MLWNVLLTNADLLLQRVRLQNSCWKLGQWPVFNKIFPPNYRVNFKNVAWSHPRFICAVSYRQYINYSPYTFWAQFWFSNWIYKAFMKISTLTEIQFILQTFKSKIKIDCCIFVLFKHCIFKIGFPESYRNLDKILKGDARIV